MTKNGKREEAKQRNRLLRDRSIDVPGFNTVLILVSCYISIIITFAYLQFELVNRTLIPYAAIIGLIMFYIISNQLLLLGASGVQNHLRTPIYLEDASKARSYRTVFFFLVFIPMLTMFLSSYPGSGSPDTINQWAQVQSATFDNWHPVFHTLLIWLATRLVNAYAFVVLIQIIAYSCSLTYLFTSLIRWGLNRKVVTFILILISISSVNTRIMQFLWKDCAFTIALIILTTMLINLYLSDGKWLSNWRRIISFACVLTVATMVRHNAFFFTGTLIVLLIFYYLRKNPRVIWTILSFILLTLLIRFPLFNLLKVTYPDNMLEESVGLPMTILGDVYTENPNVLSESTRGFLEQIASAESWKVNYSIGDYNSIKWSSKASEIVRKSSAAHIARMTLEVVSKSPWLALKSVGRLTSIVWNPSSRILFTPPMLSENMPTKLDLDATASIQKIGDIANLPMDLANSIMPAVLFRNIGMQMAILLICFAISFPQNKWKSLIFVLPTLAYNFGTMLLLAGADYRFFHFNLVLTYPVCLVLLFGERKNQNDGANHGLEGEHE